MRLLQQVDRVALQLSISQKQVTVFLRHLFRECSEPFPTFVESCLEHGLLKRTYLSIHGQVQPVLGLGEVQVLAEMDPTYGTHWILEEGIVEYDPKGHVQLCLELGA